MKKPLLRTLNPYKDKYVTTVDWFFDYYGLGFKSEQGQQSNFSRVTELGNTPLLIGRVGGVHLLQTAEARQKKRFSERHFLCTAIDIRVDFTEDDQDVYRLFRYKPPTAEGRAGFVTYHGGMHNRQFPWTDEIKAELTREMDQQLASPNSKADSARCREFDRLIESIGEIGIASGLAARG